MVRNACFDKNGMKKGAWSEEEDNQLRAFVESYGHKNWRLVPKFAGLKRCGKSCRLRWVNYLKPGVVRGNFSKHEVDLIIQLKQELGNKWSVIAERLPGRTDNDIKNYWHAHISKCDNRKYTKITTRKSSMQVSDGVPVFNALDDQVSCAENPHILESSASNDHASSSDSFSENDQIDFWNDPLLAYVANHENENYLPILHEEGDQLSIMSPMSSSLLSNFGWIAEGYEHGTISPDSVIPQIYLEQESFWKEPPFSHDIQQGDINDSTTFQAEEEGSFYDPLFLSSVLL